MRRLQAGYRQSDRQTLDIMQHGCHQTCCSAALVINLDQRCCHHRGDKYTLPDVTNNIGNQGYYVCRTGGQRTSHILVHQITIATAHLGGLPHITVLPLLHRRGSQCRSHIVDTCPIVLQYKRPCECLTSVWQQGDAQVCSRVTPCSQSTAWQNHQLYTFKFQISNLK